MNALEIIAHTAELIAAILATFHFYKHSNST